MSATTSSMCERLDTVAVLAGGFFAGTALYMSIGEVPALRALGLDEHWRFFPHMYKRAALYQTGFSAIAGITGIVHGARITDAPFYRNLWIAAGTVFVGMLPYTIICMLSTNKTIIEDNKRIESSQESQFNEEAKKELLDKWAALHLVRTVGSVLGFGAMVFGLSHHKSLTFRW